MLASFPCSGGGRAGPRRVSADADSGARGRSGRLARPTAPAGAQRAPGAAGGSFCAAAGTPGALPPLCPLARGKLHFLKMHLKISWPVQLAATERAREGFKPAPRSNGGMAKHHPWGFGDTFAACGIGVCDMSFCFSWPHLRCSCPGAYSSATQSLYLKQVKQQEGLVAACAQPLKHIS